MTPDELMCEMVRASCRITCGLVSCKKAGYCTADGELLTRGLISQELHAALARAEELEWKLQNDSAIKEAVEDERAACAEIARSFGGGNIKILGGIPTLVWASRLSNDIARAIEARKD